MHQKRDFNIGIIACVISLFAILIIGTLGFHSIEGWGWINALYMTVITVSTVGYGELHPLSESGRIFTMFLIAFGVAIVAAAFSVISKTIFQYQLKLFMEKRGMHKSIDSIKDHIIVCGYGRMGSNVVTALKNAGRKVVVVENVQQIADDVERDGFLVIAGDATEDEVLTSAGIERACALVATLGSDADNLFLTLTARGMRPDLNIISRVEDENNCRKFTKAGATRVVSPLSVGSSRIIRLLTRPDIIDFVELVAEDDDVQFEVSKIEIDPNSPFAGKSLVGGLVRQHVGGMVLSIRRADGRRIFDPPAETVLHVGDSLFVVGATGERARSQNKTTY